MKPYIRRRSLENSHWYMGHLSSALATTADTNGALSVFEVTIRPGFEPPAHVHSREAEAIYMLEGRLEGWSGNQMLSVGPQQIATLPNHEPHGWEIQAGVDGETARGLVILVPGAMEQYFMRYSQSACQLELPPLNDNQYAVRMQQDVGKMIADAGEFGIQWLPPDYQPALQGKPRLPDTCLNVLGEVFKPLVKSAENGGAFTALEWISPVDSKMPKHLHQDADEAFYILSGEVMIVAGDDFKVLAQPGDFVFLPRGMPHLHRASGSTPSRAFQILTPGGVEQALALVAELPPEEVTLPNLMAIAERHRLILLPD